MNLRRLFLVGCLFISGSALAETTSDTSPPYEANWESLRDIPVPAWFDDAKFGILIHWGPYSVTGFSFGYPYTEHFPQFLYRDPGPHYKFLKKTFGEVPPDFGYKDLVPLFRAERFDPDSWASLFKRAGARYVVLTGEHHDGWANWDSDLTPWNAVDRGPHKDLVGLLGKSVRALDMKYGVSYHRERHYWFFAKEQRKLSQDPHADIAEEIRRDPEAELLYGPFEFSEDFVKDYVARWQEITDKYHPDFMWFDGFPSGGPEHESMLRDYSAKVVAGFLNQAAARKQEVYLNNKGRNVRMVNGRAWLTWPHGVGCQEADNLVQDTIGLKWQNPATLGVSYAYSRDEEEQDAYKSPTELIHLLCDVVSKNGNLLLNIGPRADGTIPEGMERRLLAMGEWLTINGEAIYGTRPWRVFGEGERIRFTAGKDAVYAILLGWPSRFSREKIPVTNFVIKSLATGSALFPETPVEVMMLGTSETLHWSRSPEGLSIEMPEEKPCNSAYVLKITHRESFN